jgi:UDP-glucose 4-epimerase
MRILITGGAGYIGYSLVKSLLNQFNGEHEITIYDNLSRRNFSFFTEARFDNKPIRFLKGDILDGRSLKAALVDQDCVVHLAAKVTTPYADTEAHYYDQINHWGTAQLIAAVEESEVSKIIYISSISVYGNTAVPVNEEIQPVPHSFYGISKLDGEQQIQSIQDKREVYVLRSGNVYGYNPSYRIDAVFNKFMFEANFQNRISIHGSGEQKRSFIHVDKIAHLIQEAIMDQYPAGVYNVVEHNLSINQVAEQIKQLYPSLEYIHVNYNVKLRDIQTEIPCKVFDYVDIPRRSLEDELLGFKSEFSF